MKKIYGIKQRNFRYETGAMQNIGDSLEFKVLSEDEQKIENLKTALEVKKIRENQAHLEAFAESSPNARKLWENNGERIIKLKEIYKSWFGINLIFDNDEGNWFDFQMEHLKFPDTATDDQINFIRELLTIEFFSFHEIEIPKNQKYYHVQYNKEFFPNQNRGNFKPPCKTLEFVRFENIFLEEKNAKKSAAFHLHKVIESNLWSGYEDFDYGGFKGELNQISHNPDELKTLLNKSYFIKYDKKKLKVFIDSGEEIEEFASDLIELNEILIIPIFFVVEKK
jgi:hypothetical protein